MSNPARRLLVVLPLLLTASPALAGPSTGATKVELAHRSPERFNVATNPLGPLILFFNVSASYAITDHVAIRADANALNPTTGYLGIIVTGVRRPTYEFGLSAPIYLRRMYDGPFLEPGVMVRNYTTCTEYAVSCSDAPGAGPELLAGYHWKHSSGWNIAVAVGAARMPVEFVQSDYGRSYNKHEFVPATYLRAGYAF